jgi:hypothetical protein
VSIAILAVLLAGSLSMARAAIVVQNVWHLGEADSPTAVIGQAGDTTTVDSMGSANLTATGSGTTYASTTVPNSLVGMSFNGTSGYSGSAVLTTTTDDFGIEIWADPTAYTNATVFYDGNTADSGWGIYQYENEWTLLYGGVILNGVGAPVTLGTFNDLALVVEGGVASFYVNGELTGTVSGYTPNDPSQYVFIGTDEAGGNFVGSLDEARIFTFTDGQFSTSDLQYVAPEPSSLVLAGFGGIALAGWVRRRRAIR